MRQLSENDAAYIYSDSAHSNSNVTLLHIYDQSSAAGGIVRFKQILAHVESRISQWPLFRQKILRVPLDLDYPYWVEDEHFDIQYHIRHIALPKPGDWRQFCIQAARIHARALDRQRPLWEMYVIEGLDSLLDLPPGSFAVLLKLHHAAVDVSQHSELTQMLHDLSPTAPDATPLPPWFPAPPPGHLALLWRAGFKAALLPWRMTQALPRNWRTLQATLNTFVGEFLGRPQAFPMTRFNTEVSAHRVFETRRFAGQDMAAIAALVPDAGIDDAVLAVCAGGLRRYLELQGELPVEPLVVAAPIALATEAGAPARSSWARVALATDIAEPLPRLAAIQAETASAGVKAQALGAQELTELAQHAPSAAVAVSSKMLRAAASRLGHWVPLANCAIANLPGPPDALYLQGARLTYLSALLPISDGMGLVFAVTHYQQMVIVSITACALQLPDPERFAQCLRESFQEYLALVAPPFNPDPKDDPI